MIEKRRGAAALRLLARGARRVVAATSIAAVTERLAVADARDQQRRNRSGCLQFTRGRHGWLEEVVAVENQNGRPRPGIVAGFRRRDVDRVIR
jgi:hypothetical protein